MRWRAWLLVAVVVGVLAVLLLPAASLISYNMNKTEHSTPWENVIRQVQVPRCQVLTSVTSTDTAFVFTVRPAEPGEGPRELTVARYQATTLRGSVRLRENVYPECAGS